MTNDFKPFGPAIESLANEEEGNQVELLDAVMARAN